MRGLDFITLFRARTPPAQQALERFWANYQTYLEINNSIALTILVWGPGLSSSSRIANKRKDVHTALLQQGHNALFSEELVAKDLDPAHDQHDQHEQFALRTLEYAQAEAADLIIILLGDEAMGALAEALDFGTHPDLAGKIFVLAPRAYKDGYAGRGTLWLLEKGFGAVHWYADPEIESCNVLSEALIRVQARREIYAFSAQQRGRRL